METFHCSVCEKDRYEKVAEIDGEFCCSVCAEDHNGPGKYERYSNNNPDGHELEDLESLGICLLLNHWSMNDGADEWMSNEGWGYLARIDKYLLFEDDRGFVTYEEYDDAEKADNQYQNLFADGWGAEEDDGYISHDRGRWYVQFNSKELKVWPNKKGDITERRCIARIRLEMSTSGFYPNVWLVNERGTLTLAKGV